ncbi:MAG: TolC family protein [Saprospiraceae bacterium]|nr:TolC family protein [Saprospiraceae bacterium]
MKKMTNFCLPLLILACALLLAGAAQAQTDSLTLEAAIRMAKDQSIDQKQAALNSLTAQIDQAVFESSLKPQFSANANVPNYFKTSTGITQPNGSLAFQDISQNNGSLGFDLTKRLAKTNTQLFAQTNVLRFDDFSDDFTSYNGVPVRVGLIQPINQFNPNKWNQKILPLAAELAAQQANNDLELASLAVTQQYFGLLFAQVNQQIAETNIESTERIFEIAKERYALGKISKSDLLQLELSVVNAEQDLISATRSVLDNSTSLKASLNLTDVGENLAVTAPLNIPDIVIDPQQAADLAWANNPNQKNFELQLLAADRDLEQAKRDFGLQASLQASVGLTRSAEEFSEIYTDPQNETLVNLNVSLPIFDGGQRKKSIQRAEIQKDFVQENTDFTQVTFKQNVEQLALQINRLKEEVKLSERSFRLAEQRYDISNQRYALGNISITDLTIAFGERDQAWRNYINVLGAYWINYQTLQQLTLYDFTTNQKIETFK